MYGLVNKAIQDLVTTRFGNDAWERMREAADAPADFLSMEVYDDAVTYRLVQAGAELLGKPPHELLEAFGEFWTKYTASEGFGDLLDLFGAGFEEFLENLDAMHARVGLSLPELKPPSFEFERGASGEHRLHYRSERPGLAPMVIGLLRGLAERFRVKVAIAHLAAVSVPGHDVFSIRRLDG